MPERDVSQRSRYRNIAVKNLTGAFDGKILTNYIPVNRRKISARLSRIFFEQEGVRRSCFFVFAFIYKSSAPVFIIFSIGISIYDLLSDR